MSNILTLFLAPLIVAVFVLVIEYWVVQPLKDKQINKAKNPNSYPQYFSINQTLKNIVLFTGLLAFLFTIFIFIDKLELSQLYFIGMPINLSLSKLSANPLLSDANISLATIIYTCISINSVIYKNQVSWSGVFSFIILPSTLMVLWASAFLSDLWLVFLACLFISNFWLIGGLLVVAVEYLKMDKDLVSIFSLFLFPTNALILIFITNFSSFSAWFCALIILILQLVMASKNIKLEPS